jgi:hypothetical protein
VKSLSLSIWNQTDDDDDCRISGSAIMVAESHDLRRLHFFWIELRFYHWLGFPYSRIAILSLSTVLCACEPRTVSSVQKVCRQLHYVFFLPLLLRKFGSSAVLIKIVKQIKMIMFFFYFFTFVIIFWYNKSMIVWGMIFWIFIVINFIRKCKLLVMKKRLIKCNMYLIIWK